MGAPLSTKVFAVSENPKPNSKTGTPLTGVLHLFCYLVGAGVLALPYAVAWLGWVAGPVLIVVFFATSLMSAQMLSACYEVNGVEHARYHHLVAHVLSRREAIAVSVFQLTNIFLTNCAYTITGASAMQQVAQFSCSVSGVDMASAQCFSSATGGVWKLTLIFGAAEVLLSQVRNLEEAWWVSGVGAVCSLIYAFIALIIGLVHVGNGLGSVGGNPGNSTADKVFNVLNSLGAVAFAFNSSLLILEISDTMKQPPAAAKSMRTVCNAALSTTFVLYFLISVAGYSAEGNGVKGMILESFSGPAWALILANCAVVGHMLTAWQVFAQPAFNTVESHIKWARLQRSVKAAAAVAAAGHAEFAAPALSTKPSDPTKPLPDPTHVAMGSPFNSAPSSPTAIKAADPHRTALHKPLLGYDHTHLEPIEERASAALSTLATDRRLSSVLARRQSEALSAGGGGHRASSAMSIAADTGFANEEVPLNEEGYMLPLYLRFLVRTAYVLLITLLACIMPFFSAFAGLVGAVTYWPLAIYFPFACYRTIFPVSARFGAFLWVVWVSLLVVAVSASVGAVRGIITGWSTYKIFGT